MTLGHFLNHCGILAALSVNILLIISIQAMSAVSSLIVCD